MHDSIPDSISLDADRLTGFPRSDHPVGIHDLTFSIKPGTAVHMVVPRPLVEWMPDVLTGVQQPESGCMRVNGVSWNALTIHHESNLRGMIRRIFSGTAWVSNLSVLENILLPAEWNCPGSMPALLEEATAMAVQAGLPDIPRVRPHQATAQVLWICQWIRALLGSPFIILVEQARDDRFALPAFVLPRLNTCLAKGGTVIWISVIADGALPTLSQNWISIPVVASHT